MITLPTLTYAYDALEPYIDEETMHIHHTKHHQAYIDKLNVVLEKYPALRSESIEQLLLRFDTLKTDPTDKILLRNHGGGHINHTFFWTLLSKTKSVNQNLLTKITKEFGSLTSFQEEFGNKALSHFGSGWMWLVENSSKELEMYSTPNQDSPYLKGHTPLVALDVWEHAYYLKYQNRRAEYIKNWWNVLKIL